MDTSSLIDPDQRHDVVAVAAGGAETRRSLFDYTVSSSASAGLPGLTTSTPANDDHGLPAAHTATLQIPLGAT